MTTIPNSPHARDIAALLHPQTNTGEHEQVGPLILDEGKTTITYVTPNIDLRIDKLEVLRLNIGLGPNASTMSTVSADTSPGRITRSANS